MGLCLGLFLSGFMFVAQLSPSPLSVAAFGRLHSSRTTRVSGQRTRSAATPRGVLRRLFWSGKVAEALALAWALEVDSLARRDSTYSLLLGRCGGLLSLLL